MRLPLLALFAGALIAAATGAARAAEFDYPAAFATRDIPANGTTIHVRSAEIGRAHV